MQPEAVKLDEELQQRLTDAEPWGVQICQTLTEAISEFGFDESLIPTIRFEDATYELATDPLTQRQALQGVWYVDKHLKKGELIFQIDGSFYAEYDVVQPHPQDQRWFVEAMTAWGRDGNIKTDARLLSML